MTFADRVNLLVDVDDAKEILKSHKAELRKIIDENAENIGMGKLNNDEKVAISAFKTYIKHKYLKQK